MIRNYSSSSSAKFDSPDHYLWDPARVAKDDGWHDYGTNPTGPHRLDTKATEATVDLRAEQIKRLMRVGADEAAAIALVDEKQGEMLVTLSDDALESLVDEQRAEGSADMSTVNSVLLWVYGSEDEPNPEDVALQRAHVAVELEESRRKPRVGVLDGLRGFIDASVSQTIDGEPSDAENAAAGIPVGQAADGGAPGEGVPVVDTPPHLPGSEPDLTVDVPAGSLKAVLTWVDNDAARAQAALEVENRKPEADRRSTLVAQLEGLVRSDGA